ncbi:calpain-like cysteine peptidase [Strigomonas culicis]|uniref:Calpain-like cysteine peptidase n=1 Tax=Strigomonas culicis TaxID=28005 RepID=S9TWF1_9TRYP|nr:calpain-like cysteine peptidase [Strigomonas culicis]EPY22267.1 calpain-like cysteine peptidase [Strigomonas culicis]|eukprot:EPY20933.1 calpain-like cysteine peptidase [Strigomonas culicis]
MSFHKTVPLVVFDAFREDSVEPLPSGERPSSDEVLWANWGPSVAGDVTPCFKGGFLFRIYNPQTKVWALYNDTYVYEMHASLTFARDAQLEPLDGVPLLREDGQQRVSVVVYPMETVSILRGERQRFRSLFDGKPLSPAYLQRTCEAAQQRVHRAQEALARLTASTCDEEVLAVCRQHRVLFIDPSFPPCQASIDATGKLSACGWQRPSEYLPGKFHAHVRLFRRPVTPRSAQRGELADSWFLSSIAALAEDERYIKDLFRHPSEVAAETLAEEECGAHRVLMNVSGCWRSIIVDNYLPILGNQPRFARSAKDPCELWVSMMEKAYAKRSKAYSNMASGDPLLAIRDLTGFPTCRLDAKFQESVADRAQSDAFFDRLLACCENGHLILFSTPGSSDGRSKSPRYAENGVLIGYAYGVLRVARVGDERLVQLRDPWASGAHWKGRWAPGADAWARCPAAGPCFPQHGPQDASFVLDWEEACRFFVGCGVVFNHYHYIDYRIPFVFQGGVAGLCLEVAVTEPTALTVVLSSGRPARLQDA